MFKSSFINYICPNCNHRGSSMNPGSNCEKCGTEVIKKCPSCNNPIENSKAEYCKYCGNKYLK